MADFTALTFQYDEGKTCYARLFRRNSDQVVDFDSVAIHDSPAVFAHTIKACEEATADRVYKVILETWIPNGAYDLYVYEQVGEYPVATDPLIFAQTYNRRGKV